jgi:ABC-type Zn2+ transport system substrate-binding protein/surface adhesin
MDKVYVIEVGNGEFYDEYDHTSIGFALTREEAQAFIDKNSTDERRRAFNDWRFRCNEISADFNSRSPSRPDWPRVSTPTMSRVINPKMHEDYAKRVDEANAAYTINLKAYNHAYSEWAKAKDAAIKEIGPRPYYLIRDNCTMNEVERVK